MKIRVLPFVLLLAVLIGSCSTGKKALQKGNYADAVFKSIERLRSNPDSKNAIATLKNAYPFAVETLEIEIEELLGTNDANKYVFVAEKYQLLDNMAKDIRRSPAAMKIISNPKTYTSQLTAAKNKAAEEAYQNGRNLMDKNTREESREAFYAFQTCLNYNPNYKDARRLLDIARERATLKVLVEQIPVPGRYKLSSGFFYDQILSYLNSSRPNEFISFMTPKEAKKYSNIDQFMQMEFFDFQVGASKENHKEKEYTSRDSVKVGSATIDGKKVDVYNRVKASLTTHKREVSSSGVLQIRIIDAYSKKILEQRKLPGSFVWKTEWASYNGDKRALSKVQQELCKRKPASAPAPQDLFLEFTKPIYDQTKSYLRSFYRKY